MKSSNLNVYIGFDQVESVSYYTLSHSIMKQSSKPVSITPLYLDNLKDIYKRERDERQSNEFSFTRFLTPYLNNYKGWALFMDCDMMLQTDIMELFKEVEKNPGKAVYVVKHDYTPRNKTKFLGAVQYSYPRKNWSSVVLWNCEHPSNAGVTPEFVNTATPAELHRFSWLKDDEIGGLDERWNWLVGEYKNPPKDVKIVHWTVGGPWFNEYKNSDFSDEWREMNKSMTNSNQKVDNE